MDIYGMIGARFLEEFFIANMGGDPIQYYSGV